MELQIRFPKIFLDYFCQLMESGDNSAWDSYVEQLQHDSNAQMDYHCIHLDMYKSDYDS